MSGVKRGAGAARVPRYKPYPAYKDSGAEWLGEVPSHWVVKRLKFIAPVRTDKVKADAEDEVYLGLEQIESWTGRLLLDGRPDVVDSVVCAFSAGDVLFGKLRPYLAKAARPDFAGVCTSEVLPLQPTSDCLQSYLLYEVLNIAFIQWLDSLTYGTKMPRVSPSQVSDTIFMLPPQPEQRAIADFLDRETARLDALVTKKERLIDLLLEQRTALITRAVTKGLDPKVPMKNSGTEWLEQMPAHWEVRRADAFLLYEKDQVEPSTIVDDLVFHYSIPSVQTNGDGALESPTDIDSAKLRILGDRLLVSKLNPRKGVVLIASEKGVPTLCSTEFVPLKVNGCDLRWALYLFSSETTRQRLSAVVRSATRSHQRAEIAEIVKMWHGVPPLLEQRAIATFLDQESSRIDDLVAKVRVAIERLKELRIALISAAVTGKIDVRGEAA